MKGGRSLTLDAAKGVTAFLVLWGHCIQHTLLGTGDYYGNWMFMLIYSFHMPLFMLISGYLFQPRTERLTLKQLILGQLRSIGIPILVWGTLPVLLEQGLNAHFDMVRLIQSLTDIWFLWSMLVISLAVSLVVKCPALARWQEGALVLVGGILLALPVPILVNSRNLVLYMFPYFLLGYWYRKYQPRLEKGRAVQWAQRLSLALYPVLMLFFREESYIYVSGLFPASYDPAGIIRCLLNDSYRYLVGAAGSVALLTVLSFAVKRLKESRLTGLTLLGRYSLQLYVMQSFILVIPGGRLMRRIAAALAGNPLMTSQPLFNLVLTPMMAALWAVFFVGLARLLEKCKLNKLLFGR